MKARTLAALALVTTISAFNTGAANAQFAAAPRPSPNYPGTTDHNPEPIVQDSMVCFYQAQNFTGTHMCTASKGIINLPASWSGKIRSITIQHAVVKVCDEKTLKGECTSFSGHINLLPKEFVNSVRSTGIL